MITRCGGVRGGSGLGTLTLRPSGIRTARRKVPKRSSCIGIISFGAWVPSSAVSWDETSGWFILYVARLSPETTRYPSEICSDMSFVFIPGISNTAVTMDSTGSSIRSMLEEGEKIRRAVKKNSIHSDIPWSVFSRGRWRKCDDSKSARFYGLYAFEICGSVDSLDKSWMPKRLETLAVNDLTWIHFLERMRFWRGYARGEIFWM